METRFDREKSSEHHREKKARSDSASPPHSSQGYEDMTRLTSSGYPDGFGSGVQRDRLKSEIRESLTEVVKALKEKQKEFQPGTTLYKRNEELANFVNMAQEANIEVLENQKQELRNQLSFIQDKGKNELLSNRSPFEQEWTENKLLVCKQKISLLAEAQMAVYDQDWQECEQQVHSLKKQFQILTLADQELDKLSKLQEQKKGLFRYDRHGGGLTSEQWLVSERMSVCKRKLDLFIKTQQAIAGQELQNSEQLHALCELYQACKQMDKALDDFADVSQKKLLLSSMIEPYQRDYNAIQSKIPEFLPSLNANAPEENPHEQDKIQQKHHELLNLVLGDNKGKGPAHSYNSTKSDRSSDKGKGVVRPLSRPGFRDGW